MFDSDSEASPDTLHRELPLSPDFCEALSYAAQLHLRQYRKATPVPYVSHLLAVAALVLEYGGSEDEAIAALFHDAVEDQGGYPILERIRRRFGENVASIIEGCTDSDTIPKPPWRERKERHIRHMAQASPSVCLVYAADKLANARSMYKDYLTMGEDLWTRFKGGREGTLWYFREVLQVLRKNSTNSIFAELESVIKQLEG
jgi:(p)ppGpp synthase/HD superfamily hydrolase